MSIFLLMSFQFTIHTYHSRFIPERVAKASLKLLHDSPKFTRRKKVVKIITES
jgi:ribosomal protein L36